MIKRILIVRTDRIGDVVLSTPVIKAVRDANPGAFVAMMVSLYAREIVEGNPHLNEVIVFDKKRFKGVLGAFRFSALLKARKFDTALILHPAKRIHIILWLARIKKRIGLDKKWGFLLTDRLPHTKQFGQKHEIEYNLDILRMAGIESGDRQLLVPVKAENSYRIKELLKKNGFGDREDFVVIHPGASCPSKRWPSERFAIVADEIISRFHKKVVIVAGINDERFGQDVNDAMENEALDLSGDLSVGELIALLEKARFLVSNDSGPVHIAVALGVPVVAIFGRSQPGLSFKRWGPVGKDDIILHKDVGCAECLAHNCKIGFKCLMAIEPREVIEAAGRLLGING
jgi:heptosyltransferase II